MENKLIEITDDLTKSFIDNLPRISLAHVHPDYKKRFLETTKHLEKESNAIRPDEDVKCLCFYFKTTDFKYYRVNMYYDHPKFNYEL